MSDWSREEVEATVQDYLSMLASWLAGTPFSKASHRRALLPRLDGRSEKAVEFKYMNISAVLVESDFPCLPGYPPLFNYQKLLADVVNERLGGDRQLLSIAEADADAPMVVPEVEDILSVLTGRPKSNSEQSIAREAGPPAI